jgi:hypothetical protein
MTSTFLKEKVNRLSRYQKVSSKPLNKWNWLTTWIEWSISIKLFIKAIHYSCIKDVHVFKHFLVNFWIRFLKINN